MNESFQHAYKSENRMAMIWLFPQISFNQKLHPSDNNFNNSKNLSLSMAVVF